MLHARRIQLGRTSTLRLFLPVSKVSTDWCLFVVEDISVPTRDRSRTVRLDPAEDVVHIVREESSSIQHRLDHSRDRLERHLLAVRVLIPLPSQLSSAIVCPEAQAPPQSSSGPGPTSSYADRRRDSQPTSRRCLTRLTKFFPSAANPFVANTALSVLPSI